MYDGIIHTVVFFLILNSKYQDFQYKNIKINTHTHTHIHTHPKILIAGCTNYRMHIIYIYMLIHYQHNHVTHHNYTST